MSIGQAGSGGGVTEDDVTTLIDTAVEGLDVDKRLGIVQAGDNFPQANKNEWVEIGSDGQIDGVDVITGEWWMCTADDTAESTPVNWFKFKEVSGGGGGGYVDVPYEVRNTDTWTIVYLVAKYNPTTKHFIMDFSVMKAGGANSNSWSEFAKFSENDIPSIKTSRSGSATGMMIGYYTDGYQSYTLKSILAFTGGTSYFRVNEIPKDGEVVSGSVSMYLDQI